MISRIRQACLSAHERSSHARRRMTHMNKTHSGRKFCINSLVNIRKFGHCVRDFACRMSLLCRALRFCSLEIRQLLPISAPSNEMPHSITAKAPRVTNAWRCVMKFLSRLFGDRRDMNLTTALERQRLGRTMPGQTGADGRRAPRLLRLIQLPSAGSSASSRTFACKLTAARPQFIAGARGGFLLRRSTDWPICDPCRKFSVATNAAAH